MRGNLRDRQNDLKPIVHYVEVSIELLVLWSWLTFQSQDTLRGS